MQHQVVQETNTEWFDLDDLKAAAARDSEATYRAAGSADPLRAEGNRLIGRCPCHADEGRPNFALFADGRFKCFACGAAGSIIDFHLRLNCGVKTPGPSDFSSEIAADLGRCLGVNPRPATAAREAPPVDPVECLAAVRCWDPEALRALGARGEEGRDGRRLVVLPMCDADGQTVGWRERAGDNAQLPVGRGRTAKSKTRAGTELGLFYLPGLRDLPDPVLAVEGETDAAAALSAGHRAVVGTAGASASRDSLGWLQELLAGREVVVAPDPDAAGRGWRERLAGLLANAGCTVRLIVPDGEHDLDERLRAADDPRAELARLVTEARPYQPPEETPELAAFTGDDGRLVYPRIAEHLHARAPVFALRDRLHRYAGGVYRPDGEERVRADLADLLGERHTGHARREVVGYLCDRYPLLAEGGQEATDRLDPDLHVLNVANGLLDVRDLALHSHDPGYLSMLQIPHEWDPEAECPLIDRFLHEVFPPDAVPLAYEFTGSLLRRDLNPEKVLLLGDGQNGKSLFIDLLASLLGAHNCAAVTVQQLDESRFHAINLLGKLANFCADLPATTLRETSTFKRAVSRDPIEGEWKGVQPITFRPFCKFVFSCNVIPSTRDHSRAFYRRWLPVEFPNTFVDPAEFDEATAPPDHRPARPRDELLAELRDPAELRGLMNRSLRAAQGVAGRGGGYAQPGSVEVAQRRFRLETDTVAWFADECLSFDEGATVSRQLVYSTYTRWAEAQGVAAEPQHEFNARLEDLGAKRCQSRSGEARVKSWRGVGVIPDGEPPQNY